MNRYPIIRVLLIPLLALPIACGSDDDLSGIDGGAGSVLLFVNSSPAGADVFVDGSNAGSTTPDTLTLSPGNHSVTLRLCDYEEWTKSFVSVDGDTLIADATLEKKFDFQDDFEMGAGQWTAGCPFTFVDSTSHDGSAYVLVVNDSDCETRLIPLFEVPECQTPQVSFYYKLTTSGLVDASLKIETSIVENFMPIETTSGWIRFEVEPSAFVNLSGPASFSFVLRSNGEDTYRFSLDDFSLNAL
jgi:hypothetical protein